MELIKKEDGYHVTFTNQNGTTGSVALKTHEEFHARRMAAVMRVQDLETVSGIVDLTHQVVTQIIAGKNINVLEAIELWKSHAVTSRYLSATTVHVSYGILLHWARECLLGASAITAISPAVVAGYVNSGNERRSTAVRKLTALRQLFSFCLDSGYCTRNPAGPSLVRVNYDAFTHLEKERIEKKPFTEEEIRRLLSLAPPFWQHAITIAVATGLRLGDIINLEWASFNEDRTHLTVWTDKSNVRVSYPLSVEVYGLVTVLERWQREHLTGIQSVLFPAEHERYADPAGRAAFSVEFSRLCRKAGIEGKSFHSLRHTYASNAITTGKSILAVAKDLGHASTSTTQIYVHPARTPNS